MHLRERALLKRAAVLLFHPDPQQFVTGACVKIGRFDRSGELVHHDIVEGPVFLQPDRCLELLTTKYLAAAVTFEGLQRVERWPVPLVALREALLNAVAHKDYSSGVPIQLRVTDASIRLWNTAVLPDGWTADTLRTPHASLPHNPDMANAFFRAGMVEAWGSGYQRMSAACHTARVAAPLPGADGPALTMEFPFGHLPLQEDEVVTAPRLAADEDDSRLESRLESALAARILIAVGEGEIGRRALAEAIGHRAVSGELHKQLARLKSAGLIEPTLPDRPNSRLQRYRCTATGLALLRNPRASLQSR